MDEVLLLINSISDQPSKDELDVLVQAEAVEHALAELGYSSSRDFFGLDLGPLSERLKNSPPGLVFNLVETVGNMGALIHLCPSLLEAYRLPFTGSGSFAMLTTTNKIRTKQILNLYRIPTPELIIPGNSNIPRNHKKYILKPVWEDGSAGITDDSILNGGDINMNIFSENGRFKDAFLEEYIDGREFNITVLGGEKGPEVMPVAEMLYIDYPEGKPRILNYASKWNEDSFEYHNTVRSFDIPPADRLLVEKMTEISLRCWNIFDMAGYTRVDFRVDRNKRPYVLEVNANPCLSPDAGFPAACYHGGISYTEMINRIISTAKC